MDAILIQICELMARTKQFCSTHLWEIVSLIELLFIIYLCAKLLIRSKPKGEKQQTKEKVLKEGDIDFSNIINSSFKAKELYDQLKKVCHPDKFAKDPVLNATATEIFGLLVKSKHDYNALCKLKERAINELHIN